MARAKNVSQKRIIHVLVGKSKKKSLRHFKYSLLLSICISVLVNELRIAERIGTEELVTVGLLVLVVSIPIISSYKNNGLLTAVLIPSLFVFSLVTGGFGVGWTHDPTVVEKHLLTPIRFTIMIGLPIGIIGYSLGRLAEASSLFSS